MQKGFSFFLFFLTCFSDPFERSMSLWIMNEYVFSAETFLEDASYPERIQDREINIERINCDDIFVFFMIFNYYFHLRDILDNNHSRISLISIRF